MPKRVMTEKKSFSCILRKKFVSEISYQFPPFIGQRWDKDTGQAVRGLKTFGDAAKLQILTKNASQYLQLRKCAQLLKHK